MQVTQMCSMLGEVDQYSLGSNPRHALLSDSSHSLLSSHPISGRKHVLKLEAFFPAKVASVEVGAGILALLAWLACCLGCDMVGALLGMCR